MDLREYLVAEDVPAERFARRIDLGVSTVRRLLRGGRPSARVALAVVEGTDNKVSLEELLRGRPSSNQ